MLFCVKIECEVLKPQTALTAGAALVHRPYRRAPRPPSMQPSSILPIATSVTRSPAARCHRASYSIGKRQVCTDSSLGRGAAAGNLFSRHARHSSGAKCAPLLSTDEYRVRRPLLALSGQVLRPAVTSANDPKRTLLMTQSGLSGAASAKKEFGTTLARGTILSALSLQYNKSGPISLFTGTAVSDHR